MDRPIFIVGCPRSGTGLLHQLVRLHPEVAWVTPLSNWVCGKSWFRAVPPRAAWPVEWALHRTPNALLPRLLQGPFDGSLNVRGVFETHEGHSIWNRALPAAPNDVATEDDVTPRLSAYISDVLQWHRRYHGRPRFVWKTPRNVFRLRFLHALFPRAFVVHLIRDGRAVAASILKRRRERGAPDRWWGVRPPGWQSVQSRPPLMQAAWTWAQCVKRVETDASVFPNDHVLDVTYESLTTEPETVLRRVFSSADLTPTPFFTSDRRRQLRKIRPPRHTWQTRLAEEQTDRLQETLTPLLQEYGYEATKNLL